MKTLKIILFSALYTIVSMLAILIGLSIGYFMFGPIIDSPRNNLIFGFLIGLGTGLSVLAVYITFKRNKINSFCITIPMEENHKLNISYLDIDK